MRLWPELAATASLLRDWRHMTDLNFASGADRRADDGRAATTHMAEGNTIVPAHPIPRHATFPSMLAALSLEQIAREAAASHGHSAREHTCRAGKRTLFFRVRAPNASLDPTPSPPIAGPVEPEDWWARGRDARGT
jgi:hypothetical protein